MAAYWEISAHSADDMFSKYKYKVPYCQFGFSPPRFLDWVFLSTCTFLYPDSSKQFITREHEHWKSGIEHVTFQKR